MFNQAQRLPSAHDEAVKRGRLRSLRAVANLRDRVVLHGTAACEMPGYSSRVANSLMTYAAGLGSSLRLFEMRLRRRVRRRRDRRTPSPAPSHRSAELACAECGAVTGRLVLLTSSHRYYACAACLHRWTTAA